jgi:hypothetical protein
MEEKICPFKLIATSGHVSLECESNCEWLLDNGRCAITEIAIRLLEKEKE